MNDDSDWVSGQVTLRINDVPITFEMTVPAAAVKPQRMLPVLQNITGAFVDIGVQAAVADGRQISCAAGCGACCRQVVPLSEIEAYQIAELVAAMPEPRRTEIAERFERAVGHFARNGWFARLQECETDDKDFFMKVVLDYFHEGVPCPFLEDESCSIHPDRPLSCREYLVTSPPENCSKPSAEGIDKVLIPASASTIVRYVGQTVNRGRVNFIPLILALKWTSSVPESFAEKTGEQWMAEFFGLLTSGEIRTDADGSTN